MVKGTEKKRLTLYCRSNGKKNNYHNKAAKTGWANEQLKSLNKAW
jgi:hypothetical protein